MLKEKELKKQRLLKEKEGNNPITDIPPPPPSQPDTREGTGDSEPNAPQVPPSLIIPHTSFTKKMEDPKSPFSKMSVLGRSSVFIDLDVLKELGMDVDPWLKPYDNPPRSSGPLCLFSSHDCQEREFHYYCKI